MDTIKHYSEPNVLIVAVGSSQLELNYARNILTTDWSMNLFFRGNRKSISEHKKMLTNVLDSFPTLEIVIVLIASEEKDILKHGLTLSRIAKNRGLVSVVAAQNSMGSIIRKESFHTYADSLLLCPTRQQNNNRLLKQLGKKWFPKKDVYQQAKEFLHIIRKIETTTGFINLDSADICSVLKNSENAYCWEGTVEPGSSSEWFSRMLCQSGITKERITTAKRILLWAAVPLDCDLEEIEHAARLASEQFSSDAVIILGSVFDEELSDKLYIGILATEFDL